MKTDTVEFLHIFLMLYFVSWVITWMKKTKIFQMARVQPQGVAWLLLLNFLPFQPGAAYRSNAY